METNHTPTNGNGKKAAGEFLVTRQPIFDKGKEVFAYSLLFQAEFPARLDVRKSPQGEDENGLKAVDGFLLNGLKTLSGGKKAFVHFTPDLVLSEFPFMFPKDILGVELLETPVSREQMEAAVRKLKEAGYVVMMGDHVLAKENLSLVSMADIIGCDFRHLDAKGCACILKGRQTEKIKFLAKSVETETDYREAVGKGYQYFQGDFFSKADLVPIRNVPSHKMNLLKILKEINQPSVKFDKIEKILKRDVSITYKLLRFINSASFGFRVSVDSIRHALSLLGEDELRKWLSLIILSGTGTNKPQELITNTIVRAKFCESLAARSAPEKELPRYFLMGMFSMVDAFLDRPMDEVLGELPLDGVIKEALMGDDNSFRDVLDVVIDYEKGDWKNFDVSARKLNLSKRDTVTHYLEAVEWGAVL